MKKPQAPRDPFIHLPFTRDQIRRLDTLIGPAKSHTSRLQARIRFCMRLIAKRLEAVKLEDDPLDRVNLRKLNPPDRRVVELFRQGFSRNAIARILNEEGIPARKHGQWRHRSVQMVLDRIRKDCA